MTKGLAAIILAAGKSTRLKSNTPKVLHRICGREMLFYSLDLCLNLKIHQIIIVLGKSCESILDYLEKNYKHSNIEVAIQKRSLGTADAVLSVRPKLKRYISNLLILYADQPLLSLNTARRLWSQHYKTAAAATLLTATLDEPLGYGRIIRDKKDKISRICEDKDLNKQGFNIREINAGSCIFKKVELFRVINRIKPDNRKKEYYLTGAISLLANSYRKISFVKTKDISNVLGANSRLDLIKLDQILRERLINKFLAGGVTITSPDTTFINYGAKIGQDTVVKPFVYIDSDVKIGKNCIIGPFCHIRGGTIIKDNTVVGSFAELNRSYVDSQSRIKHFTYLGDARLGKNVNIGAGVVTANFDGKHKNKTYIKDGAFIGSDTILVAPVKVGKSSVTGAGSVIPKHKDVPDKTVVLGVPAKEYKRGK